MAIDNLKTGGHKPLTYQLAVRGGVGEATLAGNVTLTHKSSQFLRLDPGGAARDVTLPAVRDGLRFRILNTADAAETITVKNAAGSTILTITQGQTGEAWCTSTGWVSGGAWTAS